MYVETDELDPVHLKYFQKQAQNLGLSLESYLAIRLKELYHKENNIIPIRPEESAKGAG